MAYFKVKIQALAQKSVQEKGSIISIRYGQTNLSLWSLFGITRQSLTFFKLLDLEKAFDRVPRKKNLVGLVLRNGL